MTGPEVLWRPDPEQVGATALGAFVRWLGEHRGLRFDLDDYAALHAWSVTDLDGFWSAAAQFLGVRWHDAPTATLGARTMPGAEWFPGATLNYAEHVLAPGLGDDGPAVVDRREDGGRRSVTRDELRELVGRAQAGLVRLGVGRGDRVVALAPNRIETLVTLLATAGLGAVWSSCSPDFGARAVLDRFGQLEPAVLLAVDRCRYGGKDFDVSGTVRALRAGLPTLRATVCIDGATDPGDDGLMPWDEFTGEAGPPVFDPVPFDHPLWVLYSSGTTGRPKGIVQGHGGIVLEHLKSLRLHHDLGPGDVFFWFTTTGWMMWNYLVGGLLTGSRIVLYDGSPAHPDLGALWRMAEEEGVTYFGTSAPFVQAALKAELRPGLGLTRLRAVGSTGSPLTAEGFRWIRDAIGEHVQICSVSGGSDLCTAFVGAAPTVPVWLGEISCPLLGAAVSAYDERGEAVVEETGELVLTQPMPSMPVQFWNDLDGTRLREAYFADYPGVWRHGDWVRVTERGSLVIYGRSDATLNRGGVRMGTADFYAVVEGFDEVVDSLVVDTTALGAADEGALLCFLVLADGVALDDVVPALRAALRTELSPRHVPDRFAVVDAVPRTLNGKKCEVPVRRILAGMPMDQAVSRGALADPEALAPFVALAARPPA